MFVIVDTDEGERCVNINHIESIERKDKGCCIRLVSGDYAVLLEDYDRIVAKIRTMTEVKHG